METNNIVFLSNQLKITAVNFYDQILINKCPQVSALINFLSCYIPHMCMKLNLRVCTELNLKVTIGIYKQTGRNCGLKKYIATEQTVWNCDGQMSAFKS